MGVDRAYFVMGEKVLPYDIENDAATGDASSLAELWQNMPASFASGIDAALDLGTAQLYVFRGAEYVRIPFGTQAVDEGYPAPIAGNWGTLSFGQVDAAMNWGDGKVYFFQGTQYVRYDIAGNKQDPNYPKPIAGNWTGVSAAWVGDGIDAAINPGNGNAYFFKGDEYVTIDWQSKAQVAGPTSVSDPAAGWSGLTGPFDAAWTNAAAPPPTAAASGDDTGGWVRIVDELRIGGTLAWRNNNPGNLLPGRMPYRTALAIDRRGLAIFPSYDHGWQALREVLRSSTYSPLSIADALQKYAPAGHGNNDPALYAERVHKLTGLDASRVVETLDDAELESFMGAIKKVEGFSEGVVYHRGDDLAPELAALFD